MAQMRYKKIRDFVRCGLFGCFIATISGCPGSVEIIAHRGASHLAPENTMASVLLGWEKGADVEVDVHLSQDQRIVVIHDASTKRTTGVDLKVADTPSHELRALDAGRLKGAEFAGEPIPCWPTWSRQSLPDGGSMWR